MVQIRVMTDDKAAGKRVLEVLEPLLRSCTALVVSEGADLTHRSGGLRVTYEVMLAPNATTHTVERDDQEVTVERADAPRRSRGRRGLPRGRRSLDP
ncbi:hypothetical protein [Streptomyces sp. NPDC004376]